MLYFSQIIKIIIVIFCLCSSPFLFLIKNQKTVISSDIRRDNSTPHASSPDFTIGPENNLYLVFVEFSKEKRQIVFLQANSDFEWNLTKKYLKELDTLETTLTSPSITIINGGIYVVFIETTHEKSSLIILQRDGNNRWSTFENITSFTHTFSYPTMLSYQDLLQVSWVSNGRNEGNSSLNYKKYNLTSQSWGSKKIVREIVDYSCLWPSVAFDKDGNCHYAWSEGEENYEKILHLKVLKNDTKTSISRLTSGDNRCSKSAICVENDGTVNVFWNNITNQNSDLKGANSIYYRKKLPLSWSNIAKVAPYISPLQPGGADAFDPTVTLTNQQILWLGYEYHQDYLQEQGVAIRPRRNNNWEPSERVTTVRNTPKDLVINADQNGNIHCIWLDFRSQMSYEVYYRVRETTSYWSEEIKLTDFGGDPNKYGGLITVVIVGLIALSLPIAIYVIIRNRKRQKIIDQKKKELIDE
ncbi:MAG: hypothetical protein GF308_11050 [Candidatus Heimdallarchaeota archaeon]|nr:hypothetical protein [Candidatus Heimdallarchaeota archaeon]